MVRSILPLPFCSTFVCRLDQPAGGASLTHCRRLAISDWSDLSISGRKAA